MNKFTFVDQSASTNRIHPYSINEHEEWSFGVYYGLFPPDEWEGVFTHPFMLKECIDHVKDSSIIIIIEAFDFDEREVAKYIREVNPDALVISLMPNQWLENWTYNFAENANEAVHNLEYVDVILTYLPCQPLADMVNTHMTQSVIYCPPPYDLDILQDSYAEHMSLAEPHEDDVSGKWMIGPRYTSIEPMCVASTYMLARLYDIPIFSTYDGTKEEYLLMPKQKLPPKELHMLWPCRFRQWIHAIGRSEGVLSIRHINALGRCTLAAFLGGNVSIGACSNFQTLLFPELIVNNNVTDINTFKDKFDLAQTDKVRLLDKATERIRANKHAAIEKFWKEITPLRRI